MEQQSFTPLVFAAFVVVIIWIGSSQIRSFLNFRRYDFNWYRREFPNLVKNGQVACYQCGSNDMGVERKLERTYMRSHICRRCGTTLYYSREQ